MVTPAQAIHFHAHWTPTLHAPLEKSLAQKVYHFVKNVVLFIPNFIIDRMVRWVVFPRPSLLKSLDFASHISEFKQFWVEGSKDKKSDSVLNQSWWKVLSPFGNYSTTTVLNITTPDGTVLKGHFLKHKDHDLHPKSRVIILFPGEHTIYQESYNSYEMMKPIADSNIPYSFLLFNSRDIGESAGASLNSRNLLLDAEAVYQLAAEELKIPESRIDLYGHSMGAAQAAALKAHHPSTGGKLLLDRTFSTLDENVAHTLGILPKCIQHVAIRCIKRFGWEFDNRQSLQGIKDEVHIFHHLNDKTIPKTCSLGQVVLTNNPHPAKIFVHTYNEPDLKVDLHTRPLRYLKLENAANFKDNQELLKHIFNEEVSKEEMLLVVNNAALNAKEALEHMVDFSSKGDLAVVQALVDKGASPQHGLLAAIQGGHLAVVEFLLKSGATLNPTYSPQAIIVNRGPFLRAAIESGNLAMVKLLLANKADPNEGDSLKGLPLHIAVKSGKEDLVHELLQANGIDPNKATFAGTPLSLAVSSGASDGIIQDLLDHGADPNGTSSNNEYKAYGESPISQAYKLNRSKVFDMLVKAAKKKLSSANL
jgi:ankyrin repeat protein